MRKELTCVLIDNDEEDHEIFGMALEELEGVRCTYFLDSEKALASFNEPSFVPDFIFIDMNMPRLSGLDCVHAIRKRTHLHRSVVYLYSTHADPSAVEDAIKVGASGYLAKAPHFDTLVGDLRAIFAQSCAPAQ